MIRKLIPMKLRLYAKVFFRHITDVKSGIIKDFASAQGAINARDSIQMKQDLGSNVRKIENIKIASQQIEKIVIHPGEIFSFWKVVGEPSEARGYKRSRSIVSQKVSETVGGGLCQLSGLIYHLSLLCGLHILERHNHTMDIYAENERYTPLGSDATVVYGYKDLRIQNPYEAPIKFEFLIGKDVIEARIISENNMARHEISFERVLSTGKEIEVATLRNGHEIVRSRYKVKPS